MALQPRLCSPILARLVGPDLVWSHDVVDNTRALVPRLGCLTPPEQKGSRVAIPRRRLSVFSRQLLVRRVGLADDLRAEPVHGYPQPHHPPARRRRRPAERRAASGMGRWLHARRDHAGNMLRDPKVMGSTPIGHPIAPGHAVARQTQAAERAIRSTAWWSVAGWMPAAFGVLSFVSWPCRLRSARRSRSASCRCRRGRSGSRSRARRGRRGTSRHRRLAPSWQ